MEKSLIAEKLITENLRKELAAARKESGVHEKRLTRAEIDYHGEKTSKASAIKQAGIQRYQM